MMSGGGRRRVLALAVTAAAAVAMAVVVTGRGCGGGDGSPEGAARLFVAASRAGDKQAVWDLLGPRTRAKLLQAAEDATNRQGGPRRYGPLDMIEMTVSERSYAPGDVILREKSTDTAVVDVLGPSGRRDELSLVKVGKRWRVELVPAAAP